MKLSRRDKSATADAQVGTVAVEDTEAGPGGKGRPTPKRRESQGTRGPVSAPRTRKEAYARQKQLGRQQKTAAKSSAKSAPAKPRSVAEQRAALRRGDPSALPRRDQGPTRKLARDYVDSTRMFSNYLLWLFPIMLASAFVRGLQYVQFAVLLAFMGLLVEWFIVGKRIRALAIERFGSAQGGNMTIGFYAGGRAYLPRKWRLPAPQVQRGDKI